ncbi:hypothetical protein ACE14D_10840, partial [Streptomyces sp. Act-28]
GTGTVLGDMIEANALGAVHGVGRARPGGRGGGEGARGRTPGPGGLAAGGDDTVAPPRDSRNSAPEAVPARP